MFIHQLKLTNFRNYPHLEAKLPPGLVLFHGDNAQGKTNLLEAVSFLSLTRSFRAEAEKELVSWQAEPAFARVTGLFTTKHGTLNIEIAIQPGSAEARKRLWLNGVARRASEILGQVPTVAFSVQDINLVNGPPGQRRRYLDILACQIDPPYMRHLQRYQRVIEQRNHLLRLIRSGQAQTQELGVWNQELVTAGSYLISLRRKLTDVLREKGDGLHRRLTREGEPLEINYLPSVEEEKFSAALAQGQGREIESGLSLWGPHRDDLRFLMAGRDMASYASRGQQRTIALALKLAEAEVLRDKKEETPILLLDDVFSELDPPRQEQLMASVSSDYQQVLITTTDLAGLPQPALAQATRFHVRQGQLFASP